MHPEAQQGRSDLHSGWSGVEAGVGVVLAC